ncbi:hypothetical protein FGIG_00422 [Fasciola gigantica]|uniref:Uncharacterized protein n=1 Tax=Fasciola gigantica TaxID=46835 RepID=A0A504Y6B3_FASGI|nr:hypothetical protein FGIG_00422 [Fasciola gigantica]
MTLKRVTSKTTKVSVDQSNSHRPTMRFPIVPGEELQRLMFSRTDRSSIHPVNDLKAIHASLFDSGATWMLHFVRSKSSTFWLVEVKFVTNLRRTCAKINPKFYRLESGRLSLATSETEHQFQRAFATNHLKLLYTHGDRSVCSLSLSTCMSRYDSDDDHRLALPVFFYRPF